MMTEAMLAEQLATELLGKVAVLGQLSERARFLERPESLPDDTVHSGDISLAEWEHRVVTEAIAVGRLTWRYVLLDATSMALAQRDWPMLRGALLTLSAECVNWILDGDRRELAAQRPLIERLDWWGKDGERIGTPGHVDLDEFTAAADERARIDLDLDAPGDLPSATSQARHLWSRPLTLEYAIRVYKADEHRARELVDAGEYHEPCGAADVGALPYTVIDVVQ
jgi:hypothetical protein